MIAATREAIAQAALRMADARDALQAQNAASAWAGLAVTLELSGPLIPITPETYNEVDTTCSPGIDGVAVRIGSKLECVFPSTSLMRSWRPGDALASAITAATGDPGLGLRESPQAQPGAIAKARGAVFYRFRTVHVSDTGTFLHRGGRIVLEQNLTEQSLRDWAIDMAAHLCVRAKRATGDRRIAVHYLPASGRDEVQPAGLAEQAVTAAALLKFSVMIEPESASAKDARSCGQRLLEAIASRSGGDPAASPVSAAAFIGAATQIDLPAPGAVKDCFDRCAATLREAVDPKTGFRDTVPQPTRGMVAWGLAALAKFSRTPADQSAAAAAAAAVYSATPIEKLPSQMPWLGWASVTAASAGEPVAAAPALREMREMIWKHQLASADLEPHDQDLAGGIVFTSGSIRLPTWQTARPAAILATMFAEPALTDAGERGPEAGRLLATLRYLRQLAADESVCAMYPLPERARGGIRAALWDQRMPPEATAITLMTVCESLRGFRATPAK